MNEERQSFMLYANRNNLQDKKVVPIQGATENKYPIYNQQELDFQKFETLKSFNNLDVRKSLISFRPPHNIATRSRLGNMFESDPTVKRVLKFFTQYVMGTDIKRRVVPLTSDRPPKRSESDDVVDKILGRKQHKKFKEAIAKIDEMSEIFSHVRRAYQEHYVYGVAALWKTWNSKEIKTPKSSVTIPVGTPCYIKHIDSFRLGSIHMDTESFEPMLYEYDNQHQTVAPLRDDNGEEYLELVYNKDYDPYKARIEGPVMLPFKRLIVFNRENPGVTPDTYQYGMSPLLPLMFHSENLRRIDQKILPELNETQYAPVGIFTVTKESSYNLEELAAQLSIAGNKIVINDDVKYQEVKINNSLEQILHEKDVLKKDILMGTGMPSSIFHSEEMNNRSTAEITVNIFQSVTLDDERNFINDVMWKYWYRDLLGKFFPDEPYLDLEIKVELEFPNRTFTPFVDKAASLQEAFLNGGITKPEWRVGINFPSYAEEELTIPESADQKSNFGNQMGGNPNPDGSGTPTASAPTTKNNQKQGGVKPPSGNQNLQGNQNTVQQAKQVKKKPATA